MLGLGDGGHANSRKSWLGRCGIEAGARGAARVLLDDVWRFRLHTITVEAMASRKIQCRLSKRLRIEGDAMGGAASVHP